MLDLEQVARYMIPFSAQLFHQGSYDLRNVAQLRISVVVVDETKSGVFL
jgi:hypothetical protein